MAAAATDKLRKKKSNFSTTLSSGVDDSTQTIPLNSASGLPTDTAITLTINRVDANGVSTPTAMERVTGVVSGNNLTNCLRGEDGSTAQAHSSGAVVEDIWDADTWNDLVAVLMSNFEQLSGRMKNETFYAADGGASDAYAITLSPAPAAYVTGMLVIFKANTINTGAATLNVNSLGAKDIKKWYNIALADGDIKASQIVACVYDGTNFQMFSEVANVVDLATAQTLINKTLTSPTLNTPIISTPTMRLWDAWEDANETWAYASASTITVPAGAASKYQKGMPFKLTANSVELQGYIIGVADTLLTVVGDALTNHTFTNNYYAPSGTSPVGFDDTFSWTPVITYAGGTTDPTSNTVNEATFSIKGNMVTINLKSTIVRGSGNRTQVLYSCPVQGLTQGLPMTCIATIVAGLICNITIATNKFLVGTTAMTSDGYITFAGTYRY